MSKRTIIIGGFIGLLPAGGVTWDYVQYPLGFKALGHQVYYIEDTRLYPLYQKPGSDWKDASSCVEHLKAVMDYFGFNEQWAYRDEASGKCFGLSEKKIIEICATADVFINISCSTFMRDEYLSIPVRILIDSDPMFTQIQYESEQMFTHGTSNMRALVNAHNFHFSFGESIGLNDCLIPLSDIQWKTTRQPICLNFWERIGSPDINNSAFTTLMNWSAGKKLCFKEREWGQKEEEFLRIKELPILLPAARFTMGIGQKAMGPNFFQSDLVKWGWTILDPETVAGNWLMYQQFIEGSLAEFSVAKQTYVAAKTGWFSCRSACYLAAGRPVVVQETGWSGHIPAGKGALAFNNLEEAAEAVKAVTRDYKQHCNYAKQLAAMYFDSNKVLSNLLEQVN